MSGPATVRLCSASDELAMWEVINDAAQAYRGVIAADCWKEPYMPLAELREEIGAGVIFHGYFQGERLAGVMGLQQKGDVALIRHAYVRTERQRRGIGAALLGHLGAHPGRPLLVGTWKAAYWAIRFYERHGFGQVAAEEKDRLLRAYWSVPPRQRDESVVLRRPP
jgi:GNAT superfamily N-acetyltransferase